MKAFGFEEQLDYPFPLEKSSFGKIESDILLADSGYGQGQVEMNILHLASTYTPFVNKGNMIKPILLADEEKGQVWKEHLLSEDQAEKINETLTMVVEDRSGTAAPKSLAIL